MDDAEPFKSNQAFRRAIRAKLPPWLVDRIEYWRILQRTRQLARNGPRVALSNTLPAPLIVSLTTFPPRFPMLHRTLESLVRQSMRADRIILWVAEQDVPFLPRRVRRLETRGVEIRACEDIGSYKKLLFALQEFPDAFIATADDDIFYEPYWLETMVSAVDPTEKTIVCHRAHRIRFDETGKIAPYANWQKQAQDAAARNPSTDLVPVGCAGILYPPRSLSNQVLDRTLFQRLCPTADDLWFYWMGRKAGTKTKKTSGTFPLIEWPNPEPSRLWEANRAGGNDRQVGNLEKEFGNPTELPD